MIQILRINNPGIIFVSLFFSVIFHLIAAFSSFDFSYTAVYTEPLSALIFPYIVKWENFGFYTLLVLGCIVQIIEAFLVDQILNNYKIISKRSYLGGILFVIVSSMDKTWLVFSPMQIVTLLLLVIIYNLFAVSRQEKQYKEFFNIGFAVSLSTLAYFPSISYWLFVYPAMLSVRPFHLKDILRVMVGLLTPIFIVFSLWFIFNQTNQLLGQLLEQFKLPLLKASFFSTSHSLTIAAMLSWLLISGLLLSIFPFSIAIQTRKLIGMLIIQSILIILFFFFPTHFHIGYLLLFSVPISFFLAILLSEIKHDLVANIIFGTLTLSVFSLILFN